MITTVMLLASALVNNARAQDQVPAHITLYRAGVEAFEASDYALALRRFEETIAIEAHDTIRFNIAVCLERLGRFREAIAQYDQAAASEQLELAERERARESALRLADRLGTLVVRGPDAGANVVVDGETVCTVPCTVAVDPGRRLVEVGRSVQHLDIERGHTHVADFASMVSTAPAPPTRPESGRSRWPSLLTFAGGGLVLAGTAGIVAFGLRASSLHDDFEREPTQERLDDGVRMRDLANASIAVVGVGAILATVDFLWRRDTNSTRHTRVPERSPEPPYP